MGGAETAFPAGHFYSPVVNPATIAQTRVWPDRPDISGIDFNDASHVQILSELAAGVLVHLHDIFLPHDYPPDWVLGENRSWNEQYLLRALLMHSSGFEVLFGCSYAFWRYPVLVIAALANPDGAGYRGGSFWMRRR